MTTRATWRAYQQFEYEDLTGETVASGAPFQFVDDFVGAGHGAGVPAAGSPVAGYAWVKNVSVGTPTGVAFTKGAAGGQIVCALAATAEAEEATLYWNDNNAVNTFNYAAGTACFGQIEIIAQISVLPTDTGSPVGPAYIGLGLASAWVAGAPTSLAEYLMFSLSGASGGALSCIALDGSSKGAQAVAAAPIGGAQIVLTNSGFHVFRIDFNNPADIAFYLDGNRVNPMNSITWAPGSQAAATMQPMIKVAKVVATATSVATVNVDAVQVFTARNMAIG